MRKRTSGRRFVTHSSAPGIYSFRSASLYFFRPKRLPHILVRCRIAVSFAASLARWHAPASGANQPSMFPTRPALELLPFRFTPPFPARATPCRRRIVPFHPIVVFGGDFGTGFPDKTTATEIGASTARLAPCRSWPLSTLPATTLHLRQFSLCAAASNLVVCHTTNSASRSDYQSFMAVVPGVDRHLI